MKKTGLLLALATSTLGLLLFFPSPGAAEDGPIRQRIKERLMQREQQRAAPETTADMGSKITKSGDYSFTIQHGGLSRTYRLHVPANYDPATPVPLLVALHGGGGSMDHMANDTYYGQIRKSESEGFVVVFPNGFSKLKSGKFATWNAGNCCGGARDGSVDDVGFIRQMVANLSRQLNIDRDRVHATGMSNGGLMVYRLACEVSDVFKAVAPVAGTDNTRICNPATPVSVLHIHAKNDSHVLFTGGAGPDARDEAKVTQFTSVPDSVSKWARLNGCSAAPRRILDKAGAYCEVYAPCRGNAQVQLCVTESGGHSWPGGQKPRAGEPPSQAISANDVMWDFFNRR